MGNLKSLMFGAAIVFTGIMLSLPAVADSTDVLPQGRSMINLGFSHTDVEREFDNSGTNRELGYYFNKVNITDLATPYFNQLNGIPAGTPSVDKAMTYLDATVSVEAAILSYQYGVTDKLTLALGFPYYTRARTDADFQVLLWPNTSLPLPLPPGPLDMTEEAQDILKSEFGYKPLDTWEGGPGIGDVQLGAKYLFYDTDRLKAAGGGWVKFPTGREDDETDLTDVAYGTGNYHTGIYAMMDVAPLDKMTVNFTGRYVYTWPYHRGIYMLDKSEPVFYESELPTKKVFGDYDTGDFYELETELHLDLARWLDASIGYFYKQSWSAYIDDTEVPHSEKLERMLFGGVSFTSVQAYREGEAKVPMIFSIHTEAVQSDSRNVEKPVSTFANLKFIF